MTSNGLINRHWVYVAWHLAADFLLVSVAFAVGNYVRFGGGSSWFGQFEEDLPAVIAGGLVFSCLAYIAGLYAPLRMEHAAGKRFGWLALCLVVALLVVVAFGYINWSARIGRGVMAYSALCACLLASLHHYMIYRRGRNFRERVVFIVSNRFEENEAQAFASFGSHLEFVGLVTGAGYEPVGALPVLGNIGEIEQIVEEHGVERVLCTTVGIDEPKLRRAFCQLRYSGINVVSLVNLCEEVYQFVPLEFVTPSWLLVASDAPRMLYIKKVKRAFDIVVSLIGLVVLGPVMVFGMIGVKLTSRGSVFYRQTRLGRFGHSFELLKLRSMVMDAEKHGIQWSAAGHDPRSTPIGKILRRYRIDEIPQLINVLRGEMSFVGPRPERPEFVDLLAQKVPYYQERLLVQPGLTGWAQVNYPYGASIEDAKRKLEYDLYYMKHMSVFLDLFVLLDTVAIIVKGGLSDSQRVAHPVSKAIMAHCQNESPRLDEMPTVSEPAAN